MTSRWTNWAREQFCAPTAIVRPASEAELVEVVARSAVSSCALSAPTLVHRLRLHRRGDDRHGRATASRQRGGEPGEVVDVDHPQLNVPIAVKPVDCRVDRHPNGIRQHSGAFSDVIRELGRRLRAGGGCQQQPPL